jgi:hypothetical protein
VALLAPWLRAARGIRGTRALPLVACGLLLLGVPDAGAQTAPSREYQIKAVFLYNFPQFVEWPATAFPEDAAPLVIGVLGDDPFGPYLDDIVRGEQVNNRRLTVQRYDTPKDISACQILFVSRSEGRNLERTLAALKGTTVLTVSDADRFAERGGMIQLITENGKIHLRINVEAARASGLTISSKLLRSAQIVASRGD